MVERRAGVLYNDCELVVQELHARTTAAVASKGEAFT
jgi:hypothetical protein